MNTGKSETMNDRMTSRAVILEGLKEWAIGSYPEQTAVTFLEMTTESLQRPWVRYDRESGRYWLDAETYADQGGTLSSGEKATWELAFSMICHNGELFNFLWSLDETRRNALALAIVKATHDWR